MQHKTISNLAWRFFERIGTQGISFLVSIILARILVPEDFGIIALIMIFIAILNVFVDSGLSTALIQKIDIDDLDYSTVFYFNLFVCILLYIVIFLTAPFIAKFYNNIKLISIIRVLALSLLISGVKTIQQAYVSKNMIFRIFFYATLSGTVAGGLLGIMAALNGFGVWALVIQSIAKSLIDTIVLWFKVDWHPRWLFSQKRLKNLFSYSWKLLVSALIDTGYNSLRQLIIGKVYSPADLAFYNKGDQMPDLIVININSSIDSVLFPAMSSVQNNRERVKNITRRAIRTSTYIMMPLMIGLAMCAKPLIQLLLTDKWLPSVPYLRIFCFVYLLYPIQSANLQAIKALGHSDIFLKLEIMKKTIGLIFLLGSVRLGPLAMAQSLLFTTVISSFVNAWPNKKLLNYSYSDQMKDILPIAVLGGLMGLAVFLVGLIELPLLGMLFFMMLSGTIAYIGLSVLVHSEEFFYLINVLKSYHIPKRKTASINEAHSE